MLGSLARHSIIAVPIAVMIEELGVPLPIPTDVLIVLAGTTAQGSVAHLVALFACVTAASAIGGSGLYLIVRRGGRPLVDRFGRYVHLGAEQIDRAQSLVARGGWGSIAVGRAIPGVRYATVIVCGLLKVRYRTYLLGHVVGSSVYVVIFLAIGAVFGRTVLEWVHIPSHGLRLLWLLALAVGLPALVLRAGHRARLRQPEAPSRGRTLSAGLAAGSLGTVAFAAALAATAAVADLVGASSPPDAADALLGWLLLGVELGAGVTAAILYLVLLVLLTGLAATYSEIVVPRLRGPLGGPARQALVLAILAFGLLGGLYLLSLLSRDASLVAEWRGAGGPSVLAGLSLGAVVYATTVVYGRLLTIARAPSLRRRASAGTTEGATGEPLPD